MNDLVVQGIKINDTNWIEVDRKSQVALVEEVLAYRQRN
jgi:hypothetical protein